MKNPTPTLLLISCLLPISTKALQQYQRLHAPSNHNPLQMRLNPTSFEGSRFTITEFPRPALRKFPNTNIEIFDDTLQQKCQEMMVIMYQAQGVGLAAPQVGLNENLFVYNPSGDKTSKNLERVVCNPTITQYSPDVEVEEEGCLSLRSDFCAGQVARATWIETEYQNELGQQIRRRLKGFEARVFQHEYDHLKGILCWDRFPPQDREAVQENINKLMGLYPEADATVEPNQDQAKSMQPPPLTAKRMPPLDMEATTVVQEKKQKTGFGASSSPTSGFGGGAKKSSNKKKKKK